jgi:membrane-associated protease RseP (regulator of RpoE activity)
VAVDGTPVSGRAHVIALVQRAVAEQRDARLRLWRAEASGAVPAGERETVASPRLDSDGRWRIGAVLEPIYAGRLPPELPPAIDGAPNALIAAGWQAGDVLLAVPTEVPEPEAAAAARAKGTLAVRVLRGATIQSATIAGRPDAAARKALAKLIGRQVAATAPGSITLEPVADQPTTVSLDEVPTLRGALSGVAAGDWILRAGAGPTRDEWAIELARSAEAPVTLDVPLRDAGVAFAFARQIAPIPVEGAAGVIALANHYTWYLPADMLSFIPKFFQARSEGGIDATKTLAGPIGIFSALKNSSESSFARFLKLVALLGLNLFLVNLLPIPVVDGGQLTILAIETVIRRPLPERMKLAFTYLGVAVVVSLMLFVLSLDILRKVGLA